MQEGGEARGRVWGFRVKVCQGQEGGEARGRVWGEARGIRGGRPGVEDGGRPGVGRGRHGGPQRQGLAVSCEANGPGGPPLSFRCVLCWTSSPPPTPQVRAVLDRIGSLRLFTPGNPSGSYNLILSHATHHMVARRLLIAYIQQYDNKLTAYPHHICFTSYIVGGKAMVRGGGGGGRVSLTRTTPASPQYLYILHVHSGGQSRCFFRVGGRAKWGLNSGGG